MEARGVDLANWTLQTSLKFTTGVKYQFHQGFFYQIRDPEIRITPYFTIFMKQVQFIGLFLVAITFTVNLPGLVYYFQHGEIFS